MLRKTDENQSIVEIVKIYTNIDDYCDSSKLELAFYEDDSDLIK